MMPQYFVYEDEGPYRDLLLQSLGARGVDVIEAHDGVKFDWKGARDEIAGLYAAGQKLDGMILDIFVPHKDGFEVLADLEENVPATNSVPVFLWTDAADPFDLPGAPGARLAMRVVKKTVGNAEESVARLLEAIEI